MGKYVEDSDSGKRWPVESPVPEIVWIEDVGVTIEWPWESWTGPNGARAAAESSMGAWTTWNCTMHPDPKHRAWFSVQPTERLARLRQRARTMSGTVPQP